MNESADNVSRCDALDKRRTFFARLTLFLSAIIGAIIVLPGFSFVLAPVFRRRAEIWRSVGKVDDFDKGATVLVRFEDPSPKRWAGTTAQSAAWLRRVNDAAFVAFSINCRHLGCPVRWLESARLFMCPCHGGVYYSDGTVAGGPPPEPLMRYDVRVREGQVEIYTAAVPLTTTPLDKDA